MNKISTDICIIGGGSGGLSVAAGSAQMGARVVLFEAGEMGGDCLNSGCVPSKALLAAGKAAYHTTGRPEMGVTGVPASINFAATKAHIAEVIDKIAPHDSVERFTGLGVTVIKEKARFTGPRTVASATHEVTAKYIVIATGSTPFVPPIPGLDSVPYHTNETIFADPEKPAHLVIIGGGPIGIEMAQAHARLGCQVSVVEALTMMGRDDRELVGILRDRLIEDGISIIEGTGVTSVSKNRDGINITLGDGRELHASHLLVAVGRRPAFDGLGLEAGGVAYTPVGITTDKRLRTSNRRVYAIGDVAGRAQFTHIAAYHAGIVIRNILFKLPARVNEAIHPWVTYTDPELAHVGLTEDAAADMWGANTIKVIRVPMSGVDRAIAERREEGMVKLVVHKNGSILGVSILAPNAGEMILAWVLAISTGQKIGKMASIIAPYPTFGDASKQAAGKFFTEKLFSHRTRRIVRFLIRI
jgi:pyruvate/2-oxoglutarate dehydrogenase complex dihydrolipoamide dehydrogenase (E3) component